MYNAARIERPLNDAYRVLIGFLGSDDQRLYPPAAATIKRQWRRLGQGDPGRAPRLHDEAALGVHGDVEVTAAQDVDLDRRLNGLLFHVEPDLREVTSGKPVHIIAGRILEIGDGYVLLGFSSAPILLTDELASGFHPGQRVTITAILVGDQFLAQKIELTPR